MSIPLSEPIWRSKCCDALMLNMGIESSIENEAVCSKCFKDNGCYAVVGITEAPAKEEWWWEYLRCYAGPLAVEDLHKGWIAREDVPKLLAEQRRKDWEEWSNHSDKLK